MLLAEPFSSGKYFDFVPDQFFLKLVVAPTVLYSLMLLLPNEDNNREHTHDS